jgi:hypothetical protein
VSATSRLLRAAGVCGAAGLLFSTGCLTSSGTRIGWSSSVRSTEYSATYQTYDGTTSVPINVRQSQISFSYEVQVSKGSLAISVQDPQGKTLWKASLSRTGSGSRLLHTGMTGSYTLVVGGQNTGGGFDIRWS